jgi:alkylmercury lyase
VWDPSGRHIIEFGISTKPISPHRFEVHGCTFWAWCAVDTLMFHRLIGAPVRVQSRCFATGVPIEVEVGLDGVQSVTPDTGMVSIVTPTLENAAAIYQAFCTQTNYFASAEAASGWQAEHPQWTVLPAADTFELYRRVTSELYG